MRSRELLVDVKKLKNSVGDLDQLQIDAATNIVDALNGVKNSVEQVEVSLAGYATEEFVTNKIAEAKLDGKVDLSNYVTKSQLDLKADGTALTSHTDNTIVHITAAERTTWNAKSNFSGNYNDLTNKPTIPSAYVHPSSHAATMITEDSTHRFVTDTEKSTWNAKSNFSGNYNDLTNKPTIPSAYVHPSSHAATMITEDTTHRFVTDAEKTAWNNKSDLILGITSSTAFRGDQGNTAYIHSQATHAPANAQANADITKEEIEAKLIGNIISHTHSQYIDDTELGTKVLTKDNTIEYTPTGDYNPVTKKYVDDAVAGSSGTDLGTYSMQYNETNDRLEFVYTPKNI